MESIETGTVVHWDGTLVPARRHNGVKASRTNMALIERWDARANSWIECGPRPAITFTTGEAQR
jgi:hypothetical protein